MLYKILRRIVLTLIKPFLMLEALFDKSYLSKHVEEPKMVSHKKWAEYLYTIGNKPGLKILEVGSREVTGESNARKHFSAAEYTGFDYYDGANVDVVGDAHKLSTYFKEGTKFDLIYSSACFEHFAMPWLVASEIAKLLKTDGIVFVETHFSFVAHERPWHFYHFTDIALKTLFSPALGFQCLDSGMSNPIVGRFSTLADKYLRNKKLKGLYCHSEYLGKKVKDVQNFDWSQIQLADIVGETKYPEPKVISDN